MQFFARLYCLISALFSRYFLNWPENEVRFSVGVSSHVGVIFYRHFPTFLSKRIHLIVACQDRKTASMANTRMLLSHSRHLQCYLKIRYIHGALRSGYTTMRNAQCAMQQFRRQPFSELGVYKKITLAYSYLYSISTISNSNLDLEHVAMEEQLNILSKPDSDTHVSSGIAHPPLLE